MCSACAACNCKRVPAHLANYTLDLNISVHSAQLSTPAQAGPHAAHCNALLSLCECEPGLEISWLDGQFLVGCLGQSCRCTLAAARAGASAVQTELNLTSMRTPCIQCNVSFDKLMCTMTACACQHTLLTHLRMATDYKRCRLHLPSHRCQPPAVRQRTCTD
jgi:hypothetical protein